MNPLLNMIAYLFRNPFTSSAGAGLLLSNLGPILTMVGTGTPFATVVADPHFQNLMTAIGLLSAKDMNVTGGRKSNA